MGKSSGSTRNSSATSPKGLSGNNNPFSFNGDRENHEEIAERWFRNGDLRVDPGDAAWEAARNLRSEQISDSIDNLTDYLAMPEVARGGAIIGVTLMPRDYEARDLINDYGADSFRISLESQTLMEIIIELRSSSMSSLFRKYR